MAELASLGESISTDICIMGGGIAGLTAAITLKEKSPHLDVLIVEKATTGWAGKADRGGGILAFLTPDDIPDDFIRFHVHNIGCFLEDQELLSEYAHTCNSVLDYLDAWGAKLAKERDGSWKYIKTPGVDVPWGMASVELDMCRCLRKHARKLECRFLDRTTMVDLLKEDDRVVGTIGFSIEDGGCCVVRSKATILANGSQNYRVLPMWSPGRGDGIAAAYRAGAQMRNAEFGSFVNMVHAASREVIFGAEDHMYNASGEDISARYRPGVQPDICAMSAIGWYKEYLNSNGPVRIKSDENVLQAGAEVLFASDLVWDRPAAIAFWSRLWEKGKSVEVEGAANMPEVIPGFVGEQSPVKVDHGMATTLPGLYAVGDVSYSGSAWTGAVPSPPGRIRGTGLMNAVWSARRGAMAAAAYAAGLVEIPGVDHAQAAELKERIFAPLRGDRGVSALDLVRAIQDAITPVRYSNWKSEERMREALGKVLEVKGRLADLTAADPHDLSRCNEAVSMALCAEMFYRASLERKESRGWFVREDYPETDNANWLKWIVLEDKDGEMSVSTEDIPMARYPIKV
ncbi:MAG: FAD-dependent oxidoreductase [Actinobacteria bacterium]|jgi:succinate dehydrogenase/fumarate reductase flavoprotein subunit|nr:MAG: FAD-dependent oxidoreductase [Actinomycetota bacterium]